MINVELAFVEDEINDFITDEASTSLACMKSALQLLSLIGVQPR